MAPSRHVTIYVTVKPSYSLQHDCHVMSWPRLGLSDDSHQMVPFYGSREGDSHAAKTR